jgi:glycerophosphoryl diester phosphodiesterase
MRQPVIAFMLAALATATAGTVFTAQGPSKGTSAPRSEGEGHSVQLGPRPFFLVNDMSDGPLKDELLACSGGPFKKTDFSIGHRGAALQFPELSNRTRRRLGWVRASSNAT